MEKIRVLVIDDSVVIRRLVTNILSEDDHIEVVGTASNGALGLAKIPQVNPDLITLDIEMPKLNGLQTLTELRKTYKNLPVIMFSTLTERGASSTLEALALGATDYVTKPTNTGNMDVSMQRIRQELIPKIKTFCKRKLGASTSPVLKLSQRRQKFSANKIEIVSIGVSTGGPNALAQLMPKIPKDFPVPIVIVQHMPALFTKLLADRLASKSQIPIQEAKNGDVLLPGQAWIAPGNFHMFAKQAMNKIILHTNQDPPENSCRPAVDVLFRSVADIYGAQTLAVILTGMGQDGLRGSEQISKSGGYIIAQDQITSVVWGMPGAVASAGIADQVLPLEKIHAEIIRKVYEKRPGKLNRV